jgi:hypothetical protein
MALARRRRAGRFACSTCFGPTMPAFLSCDCSTWIMVTTGVCIQTLLLNASKMESLVAVFQVFDEADKWTARKHASLGSSQSDRVLRYSNESFGHWKTMRLVSQSTGESDHGRAAPRHE